MTDRHKLDLLGYNALLDEFCRLTERVAALEAAQKQARFDAQVQSARIDVWGSSTMRMLLKESDVTHITSEAEMVEAFGEGRGQAMWAECEARKSGGAK